MGFLGMKAESSRSISDIYGMHLTFPYHVITVTSPTGRGPIAEQSNKRRMVSLIANWQICRLGSFFLKLLNYRISSEKTMYATSEANLGKYGVNPIGCLPKEG
jgi:hypothetical protein